LIFSANVRPGPSADFGDFIPAVEEASANLKLDCVIADAGYDSEKNHQKAREELQIRSTIIPAFARRTSGPIPKGKYRKQMVQNFPKQKYKARSQVECVFSRIKKLLSPGIKSRSWEAQERECYLKLITFNLMLVAGALKT